jgi:hypothetical protein
MAAFGPLAQLDDALAWRFTDIQPIGGDVRLMARRAEGPGF